jgi:hypothetical protein
MASKWKGSYENGRKYSKAWENKFVWVSKASDGTENAYCKLCHTTIKPKVGNLTNHEKSGKHVERVKLSTTMKPIEVIRALKASDELKIADIELAVSIACHSALSTIDHLGEIVSRNAAGSKLENLKLHRRKCTKILTNVVAPALKEELIVDVKGRKFSVIVDETTDVSTTKQLCVLIRYYSQAEKKIVTAFVDLVSLVHACADDIFNAIKECLAGINLNLKDCVGYGSDGASVMVGEHDSVWTRILAVSPNCIKMTCICHSLALCVQHAFEKLPSSLGFLLAEIPKWFSKSTVRREAYETLYRLMSPDDDQAPPFEKYSTTRWLVRGKVLFNILVNWEELKAYFMVAQPASTQSARYKARLLLDMLRDPATFLYFHFVSPLVTEFERVNAFFQATEADPEEMHKELLAHRNSLRGRVFDGQGRPLAIANVDFGGKFEHEAAKYISAQPNKATAEAKVLEIKERCLQFLLEAVTQVDKRLPSARDLFKNLSALHPNKVLDASQRVPYNQLPLSHLRQENSDVIEEQYRKILHRPWKEEPIFEGTIPNSTMQFWSPIVDFQSSLGHKPFEELATYALNCLTNPVSNAVVERTFSLVTSVKTKVRNRMGLELLNAITRVRSTLQFSENCCRNFKATKRMLELFTCKMYSSASENGREQEDQ